MDENKTDSLPPTPDELKELGNKAVKNQKYHEAILHYTHALKLDPNNFTLYSNRSFAFFKLQQYYLALEDANETIKLNPLWPKGYFRKAEIEYATKNYTNALESYQKALELKPDDVNLVDAVKRTKQQINKERRADETIPWLGSGIGIVIGVILVIADCVFTNKPTHPMLMAFVTIIIAMVGYGIARSYRYYLQCQKKSFLEPPPSLFNDDDDDDGDNSVGNDENNQSKNKNHARYSKSQARHRYKKGKQ